MGGVRSGTPEPRGQTAPREVGGSLGSRGRTPRPRPDTSPSQPLCMTSTAVPLAFTPVCPGSLRAQPGRSSQVLVMSRTRGWRLGQSGRIAAATARVPAPWNGQLSPGCQPLPAHGTTQQTCAGVAGEGSGPGD